MCQLWLYLSYYLVLMLRVAFGTSFARHTSIVECLCEKTETARLFKIGLTTLYRKIEEYGIKD